MSGSNLSSPELFAELAHSADRLFHHARQSGADVIGSAGSDSITPHGNVTFAELMNGDDLYRSSGHTGLLDLGAGDDFAMVDSVGLARLGAGDDTFTASGPVSIVSAGAGDDTVNLMAGGNVDGGSGDDVFFLRGTFTAEGSGGQDTFKVFADEIDGPAADGSLLQVDGGRGFDTLDIVLDQTAPTADLLASAQNAVNAGAGIIHALALEVKSIEMIRLIIDGATYIL